VYKGVSVNVLGGSEQMYVNNLMSYLQNLNKPQVAQSVGIAAPVRPVMVSTGTGTDAPTRMVSGGIQATIATRTGTTQARSATAETGTGMDARTTAETGTGMDATADREYGTQTYGIQVLRRPRPATATTGTGTDALPSTATTGTQVSGANLAALVPLPPSPASVVEADTRGVGMQTEPQGTGARAVARLFGAIRPAIIAQRARQTATGETQTTLQATVGETQTETPARRGNYRAGFYNILPNIVPPAALAAQVSNTGIQQGYKQGRQRGEAIGAQEAIQNLRFQQTTKARGIETFTVPELQQRFAEGQIIRSYQRVGAGGGGAAAVQAAAEEAAPK
jgi:hypothetical protein